MENKQKPRKSCPRCGLPGSGPYGRWVLNHQKKRYEPYYYFSHQIHGKQSWCYIPRRWLDKSEQVKEVKCVDCSILDAQNFCSYQGATIATPNLLNTPFPCEGFNPKEKLSN